MDTTNIMLDSNTYVIVGCILLPLLALVTCGLASRQLPLPPGPPGKLISGNVHQLPKTEGYRTYAKWADVYG
jgi:hypothetical protein